MPKGRDTDVWERAEGSSRSRGPSMEVADRERSRLLDPTDEVSIKSFSRRYQETLSEESD